MERGSRGISRRIEINRGKNSPGAHVARKAIAALILLSLIGCAGQDNFRRVPRAAQSYYRLGKMYLAKGLFEEAIREFKNAIEANPRYAEAHNDLGWVYARQGR